MNKLFAATLLTICLSPFAFGQKFDFPVDLSSYDSIPKVELAGAVRTVLTMEHRSDIVFNTYVETYDQQKRLLEFLSHSGGIERHSGEMVRNDDKDIYIYAGGKVAKVISFEMDGSAAGYETFTYDSKNRLKERGYYRDGEKLAKDIYTYHTDKQEVEVDTEQVVIAPDSTNVLLTGKVVLTYNEKSQWTKRTNLDKANLITSVETFDYDKRGNIIKITHYDEKGNYSYAHVYTYKFDKQGNWIERKRTYTQLDESGQPTTENDMTIYRVITYFTDNQASNMTSTALSNPASKPIFQ